MKTILALGYHDQKSPRHQSVCKDFEKQGFTVIECRTDKPGFFPKLRDLSDQYKKLSAQADAVLIPFPGHYLMPFAWKLTRSPRKKLIFDVFLSLHDTAVDDRRTLSRLDPRAWFLFFMDWLACRLADEVLIDTEAHRQFFIRTFGVRPEKIRVVYLEARSDLFHREPKKKRHADDVFEVFFYGTYIPLQGIEFILDAAKILQDQDTNVHFTLVGSGQMLPVMKKRAADLGLMSVTFHPSVFLEELPPLMHRADLCLGVFGTSGKANRVIPHKVYDAVAAGIPVLTADTPAVRERFSSHPLVLLCPAGNPKAIADAMRARMDLLL